MDSVQVAGSGDHEAQAARSAPGRGCIVRVRRRRHLHPTLMGWEMERDGMEGTCSTDPELLTPVALLPVDAQRGPRDRWLMLCERAVRVLHTFCSCHNRCSCESSSSSSQAVRSNGPRPCLAPLWPLDIVWPSAGSLGRQHALTAPPCLQRSPRFVGVGSGLVSALPRQSTDTNCH